MAIRLGNIVREIAYVLTSKTRKSGEVPWTFRDILLVSLIVLIPVPLLPLFALLSERSKWGYDLFFCLWTVWGLFLPIIWIKRKYGIGIEHLGLKKGRWSPMWSTTIGAGVTVMYFFLASMVSGRDLKIFTTVWKNALSILSLPLSIEGFYMLVFAPVSEEIYFRGFLYGFLRTKLETRRALVLQALLFTFLHFDLSICVFLEMLLFAIVLGMLYEVSHSVYPSIICHSVMSCLIFAYRAGMGMY